MKKVCVIGLGYIGLPTACILSSKGFKADSLEPALTGLVNSIIKSGNFIDTKRA